MFLLNFCSCRLIEIFLRVSGDAFRPTVPSPPYVNEKFRVQAEAAEEALMNVTKEWQITPIIVCG